MSKNKTRKEKYTHFSIKRAEKKNYTRMCNYHLRSKNLSLKAIGLLSKVYSLPDEWNFTVAGLIAICKESETAVRTAMKELEDWGYLKITKLKPDQTASGRIEFEYVFYEYSEKDNPNEGTYSKKGEISISQVAEKQDIENLSAESLYIEKQSAENQRELSINNEVYRNKELNNQVSINPSPCDNNSAVENVEKATDRVIDGYICKKEEYEYIVKENIEFPEFADWLDDEQAAEETVSIIVRQICSSKPTETICGQEYPREIVKSAMLKVDLEIVENAIDKMGTVGEIRNIEGYLVSTLFNEVGSSHCQANHETRYCDYAIKRNFGDLDDYK